MHDDDTSHHAGRLRHAAEGPTTFTPYRILTGVAAAAVVAIVGIAALNSSNDDDDNTISAAVTTEQTGELPQIKVAAGTACGGRRRRHGCSGRRRRRALRSRAPPRSLPQINTTDELQAYAAGFRQ